MCKQVQRVCRHSLASTCTASRGGEVRISCRGQLPSALLHCRTFVPFCCSLSVALQVVGGVVVAPALQGTFGRVNKPTYRHRRNIKVPAGWSKTLVMSPLVTSTAQASPPQLTTPMRDARRLSLSPLHRPQRTSRHAPLGHLYLRARTMGRGARWRRVRCGRASSARCTCRHVPPLTRPSRPLNRGGGHCWGPARAAWHPPAYGCPWRCAVHVQGCRGVWGINSLYGGQWGSVGKHEGLSWLLVPKLINSDAAWRTEASGGNTVVAWSQTRATVPYRTRLYVCCDRAC